MQTMTNADGTRSKPIRARRWLALALGLGLGAAASGMSGCPGGVVIDPTVGIIVGIPPVLASDHVIGSANAPVTVIEYFDFQCPFCGRFARETFPQIKQQYIDSGMVRFVFRHFPLTNIHPRARPAALASECAHDQGLFDAYHDEVFERLGGLNSSQIAAELSNAKLKQYATNVGADRATFDPCADGESKGVRVQTDVDSGTALGVSQTPSFVVQNELFAGFRTAEQFSAILDRKLAE